MWQKSIPTWWRTMTQVTTTPCVYEAVNAMLLNEFLKEHRKVEKLETVLTRLEASVEKQAAQIER